MSAKPARPARKSPARDSAAEIDRILPNFQLLRILNCAATRPLPASRISECLAAKSNPVDPMLVKRNLQRMVRHGWLKLNQPSAATEAHYSAAAEGLRVLKAARNHLGRIHEL